MTSRFFSISILSFLVSMTGFTQKVEPALKELAAKFPPEKIYIHNDKDQYIAGETIWFKTYLYTNWKPSGESNNCFIQLTNDKGDVIVRKEYPVLGATVKGHIDLPDSLAQGNYYLRAFTLNSLSFDQNAIYRKRIPVYSTFKPASIEMPASALSLQFFPESGELLDNLVMVLAFKAVDEKGLPVEVSGKIKMEDGSGVTDIAPFKTYHDGIGKMQLKTRAGKKYFAEVETKDGIKKFPLPEVKAIGVNLKVTDQKNGKEFTITRRYKDRSQFNELKIVAELNNVVVYQTDIIMDNYDDAVGTIGTENLPSGILHFTVFTNRGIPIAERLSFVNNNEYRGKGEIKSVKVNLEKRAANELELEFDDKKLRSCSVSIIDPMVSGNTDQDNIVSTFLLTSDVKGYIYKPGWYFRENNDSAKVGIDNLLLTHGWTRYKWEDVLAGNLPKKEHEDPAMLTIAGKVLDAKTNAPVSNGTLNVMIELGGGKPRSYSVPVNPEGRFMLDSLGFYGETKVYFDYMDKNNKDKPITIQLEENKNSIVAAQRTISVPLVLSDVERYVNDIAAIPGTELVTRRVSVADTATTLTGVSVKTEKQREKKPADIVNEKYTTGFFAQQARTAIDNVNNPPADINMDLVRFIQNRISQVQLVEGNFYSKHKQTLGLTDWSQNFTKSTNNLQAGTVSSGAGFGSGSQTLQAQTSSQNVISGMPVQIYLNEVVVETSQLKGLSAKDVAYIKYFENFAGAGIGNIGGAIAVYTVNKDYDIKAPADYPEYALKVRGYSVTKEFFSPDYGDPEFKQPEVDNRTTLYWNPSVLMNTESGSMKFSFYNNDFSKSVKVIVEGFDADGKLIHIEKLVSK